MYNLKQMNTNREISNARYSLKTVIHYVKAYIRERDTRLHHRRSKRDC